MGSVAPEVAQPQALDAPSGLPGISRVAWGTHLCQFYRTAEDLASTLVPYFAAGLANGERCLWITAEPLGAAAARRALAREVPDLDERSRRGQIEVIEYDAWYLQNAALTMDEVLSHWVEREEAALREGYRGLRLTGNVSWLPREDWPEFEAYERRVHAAFAGRRVIAMCSYPLARCTTDEILDVVRHHGMALARRDGEWAVIQSATETLAAVVDPVGPGGDAIGHGRDGACTERAGRCADEEASPRSAAERDRDRREAAPADARSHLSRLQRVTSALLGARSAADLGTVVSTMAEVTGAASALLASARPGGTLEVVAHAGCPPAAREAPGPFALGPASPLHEVLRTGRPVVLGSTEAIGAPFRGPASGDVAAYVALPLEAGGVRRGALAFGFSRPRVFSPADQALLDDLARQAAMSLERAQLLADLEQARARAEEASRAKDEFLAMLGHELRNPLSPMLTVLQLMARRAPDALRDEREILARQLRHMERLVDDLLDVSRIVRGKLTLKPERVELGRVVAEALESASPLLEARRHRVEVSVPAAGLAVEVDRHRLVQAVLNLLTNAARYTPPGGHVTVSAEGGAGVAVLRVADDGQGIEPELAARVFELFVQGPRGLARSEGGLGLGLAIARSVVQMHGGSIRAHSDGAGRGSTFVVELPLAPGAAAHEAGGAEPAGSGASRVLVVDDNADGAETLADVLRSSGYEVRTAHDPAAALAVAEEFEPEVAIVDIGLPCMDGWVLGGKLREQQAGSPPHCIAVTGYGTETDRARSREAGFVAHLVKPIDVERLDRILAGLAAAGESRVGA